MLNFNTMKKYFAALLILLSILITNAFAQTCGVVYGNIPSSFGPVGVRAYDPLTGDWSPASLVDVNIFTAPNTINTGSPISIDPLNQKLVVVTDNATKTLAYFNLADVTGTFITFPSNLSSVTGFVLCSGFKPQSHVSYFMTSTFLNTNPSAAGEEFFSIDLTNPASPIGKSYAGILSPGSPLLSSASGGDICFDFNGVGYIITSSKQLYRFVTDEVANTVQFSFLGTLPVLPFTPYAIAFDPASSKLILGGGSSTLMLYNLADNTATPLTTTATWNSTDYASCFFPNINPGLVVTKSFYDVTQAMGPPVAVQVNDVIEYTITVKNTGNVNAGGFSISDVVPAGTTYVPNSTKLNGVTVVDSAGSSFPFANKRVANSNDNLGEGLLTTFATTGGPLCTIKYRVTVNAGNGIVIKNVVKAEVAGASPSAPIIGKDSVKFTVGVLATLPVSLLNFNAQKIDKKINLNWITTSEINNHHFEIEKSTDVIIFRKIGQVQAATQNSLVENIYNFLDNESNDNYPIIYYRLKIIDNAGRFTYSSIIRLNNSIKNEISIYPNPIKETINLSITSLQQNKVQITISNLLGQKIVTENKNIVKGQNLLAIPKPAALAKGMYFVQVKMGEELFVEKIIVE